MRIVFMGTPDFAVPTLKALVEKGHELAAVYSQPDKPKGRGHRLQATPVKEAALALGLKVYQPLGFKDADTVAELCALAPDCIVVVAYGRILPKTVLDIPKLGCINVHGSLLPRYRGAAPIQWAVLHGDKTTGITTMYMAPGMDTGDMLLRRETPIGETETSAQLFERLKDMGAQLLIETLDRLEAGTLKPEKQQEDQASYAPMITKEMYRVDWTKSAADICNQIRGFNFATTSCDDKRIKLYAAQVLPHSGKPGRLFAHAGKLCVYCGEMALEIQQLQPENGKRMTGESYLLGHPIKPDHQFI